VTGASTAADGDPEDAERTALLSRLWTETLGSSEALATADPRQTCRPPASAQAGRPLPVPDLFAMAADGGSLTDSAGSRFDLIERIGEGGMGVVWRARQASLGREVAVKQFKPGDAEADRFLAEAVVTAALDHPNILPVHCLGADAGGNLYLAMKLVRGTSWRRLLRPETAEERRSAELYDRDDHLRILLAVCRAVEYAHAKGVLHRDLKPDNVMVGDYGEILVLDWGLAVSLDEVQPALAPPIRSRTQPAGTPAYMAPEMALAQHDAMDRRSDVYLLGAILYELLTGTPPHLGRRLIDVLDAAASGHPPALPVDLPGELTEIVYTAMARDTDDRYASAADFRRAVEGFLAHRESIDLMERAAAEAEDLDREDAPGDAYRRYERHARVVARYERALESWPENTDALHGLQEARLAYARAAIERGDLGLAEAQIGRMGIDTGDEKVLRADIARRRQAIAAAERSRRRMRLLLLAAGLVIAVGAVTTSLTMAAAAERLRRSQAEQAGERSRRLEAEVARAREQVVVADRAQRRMAALAPYTEATDLLRRAEMLDNALADDLGRRSQLTDLAILRLRDALATEPEFIEARYALGEALRTAGRPLEAATEFLAADAAGRGQGRMIIPALVAAGFAYDAAGEYRRAEECFAQAESARPAGAPVGVNDALALVGTVFRLGYHERLAEALATARQALETAPQVWECRFAYGYALFQAGSTGIIDPRTANAEAEVHLRTALGLAPRQAELCAALATILVSQGSSRAQAEATRLVDRTVAIEPGNGARSVWRAVLRRARGDLAGAQADLVRAEGLSTPVSLLLMFKAQIAAADGDTDGARTMLLRLVETGAALPEQRANLWLLELRSGRRAEVADALEAWCRDHEHYPRAWLVRVQAALDLGDIPAALAACTRGLAIAPWNRELLALDAQLKQIDNRFADAVAACDRYLELVPADWRIRLLKVANLVDLRRYAEAQTQIDLLAGQDPALEPNLTPYRRLIDAAGER
jgi:tetratricopeptide (TPR) repeat protein